MSTVLEPSVVVVAGVAGTGKSTIGAQLAEAIGARFLDADALHPELNLAKMRSGNPLSDRDRLPWLDLVAEQIRSALVARTSLVVACSALKRAYRERLNPNADHRVRFVILQGSHALLAQRLNNRVGHFFQPSLLSDQLDTYESPDEDEGAILVSVDAAPADIVRTIVCKLRGGVSRKG